MNRTEKALQVVINETSSFINDNPNLRQEDRGKLDDFLYKVQGILTVEAVKIELLEECLTDRVIKYVESQHQAELSKVGAFYEGLGTDQ